MSRGDVIAWLLPVLACVGLFGAFLLESRSRREEGRLLASQIAELGTRVDRRLALEIQRSRSGLEGLESRLIALVERAVRASHPAPEEPAPESTESIPSDTDAEVAEELLAEDPVDEESLPPLPPKVAPHWMIRDLTLKQFFDDPRFNPEGRDLVDRMARQQAINTLDRAQAEVKILDSDIKLAVLEAAAELAETGDYVDYAPGEKPEAVPGVLTFAESLEGGGTRMYYLFPEACPEIYARRAEIRRISEAAMRRLMALVRSTERG